MVLYHTSRTRVSIYGSLCEVVIPPSLSRSNKSGLGHLEFPTSETGYPLESRLPENYISRLSGRKLCCVIPVGNHSVEAVVNPFSPSIIGDPRHQKRVFISSRLIRQPPGQLLVNPPDRDRPAPEGFL